MVYSQAVQQVRNDLLAWSEHKEMLGKHIQNGVARGLYPQSVADMASHYLEPVSEIEFDKLIDAAREEERG